MNLHSLNVGTSSGLTVTVVGLGKIGLPLAAQFAASGANVIGCDIDHTVVATVNAGRVPFPGEQDLGTTLAAAVDSGRLTATTDTSGAVAQSDVVVVVVPLVVDDAAQPSFTALDAATADIAAGITPGTLVIYETTVPVGTTRDRFGPQLARQSGLTPGTDFHLAFSPERVYSGRIFKDLRTYPKLVGGIDSGSAKAAIAFYEDVLQFDPRPDLGRDNGVWDLGSTEAAELAKLAETTYRDVNIALANEFAAYAERIGIDIMPVIEASNSQPFSHIHRPGLVGGHCIPVYPHFYLAGHRDAQLPATARTVNESVGGRLVQAAHDGYDLQGKTVAILGAAYRGGVRETAFSGVFQLVRALENVGALPVVHDPLFDAPALQALELTPHRLGDPCDVAFIQADHDEYRDLGPSDFPGCSLVIDIRRVLDRARFGPEIEVITLGRGTHMPILQPRTTASNE